MLNGRGPPCSALDSLAAEKNPGSTRHTFRSPTKLFDMFLQTRPERVSSRAAPCDPIKRAVPWRIRPALRSTPAVPRPSLYCSC
jgi:hypothetical protein